VHHSELTLVDGSGSVFRAPELVKFLSPILPSSAMISLTMSSFLAAVEAVAADRGVVAGVG